MTDTAVDMRFMRELEVSELDLVSGGNDFLDAIACILGILAIETVVTAALVAAFCSQVAMDIFNGSSH